MGLVDAGHTTVGITCDSSPVANVSGKAGIVDAIDEQLHQSLLRESGPVDSPKRWVDVEKQIEHVEEKEKRANSFQHNALTEEMIENIDMNSRLYLPNL